MSWMAHVITLFPDMFPGYLGYSLAGRALASNIWGCNTVDLRDFGHGKHQAVDDTPAGGGGGMVMRPDVVGEAIDYIRQGREDLPIIALSPRGRPLDQESVKTLATGRGVILFCSRFEGVDERVLKNRPIEEVSIGDYILSGGEPAALVLLDAVIRLLPLVMGNAVSHCEESFENGLLEYPHYTRPSLWEGREIPSVLLSGDHQKIEQWRQQQSEELTRNRRPELWAKRHHFDKKRK